jgi:pimeloyl-ACP methyl ester carboxylesterase
MLLRGGNSTLLPEETARETARCCPGLRLTAAEGQGHAPVLHADRTEKPGSKAGLSRFTQSNQI